MLQIIHSVTLAGNLGHDYGPAIDSISFQTQPCKAHITPKLYIAQPVGLP